MNIFFCRLLFWRPEETKHTYLKFTKGLESTAVKSLVEPYPLPCTPVEKWDDRWELGGILLQFMFVVFYASSHCVNPVPFLWLNKAIPKWFHRVPSSQKCPPWLRREEDEWKHYGQDVKVFRRRRRHGKATFQSLIVNLILVLKFSGHAFQTSETVKIHFYLYFLRKSHHPLCSNILFFGGIVITVSLSPSLILWLYDSYLYCHNPTENFYMNRFSLTISFLFLGYQSRAKTENLHRVPCKGIYWNLCKKKCQAALHLSSFHPSMLLRCNRKVIMPSFGMSKWDHLWEEDLAQWYHYLYFQTCVICIEILAPLIVLIFC